MGSGALGSDSARIASTSSCDMRRLSQVKRRRRAIFFSSSSASIPSTLAMRIAASLAMIAARLSSAPRKSSTASIDTLGTSTLTASGGAVAIVDAAALGNDVQPALPLFLGHLAPLVAVFELHAVSARDDEPEPDAHAAAEQPHAYL